MDGLGETLLFTRAKSDKNWPRTSLSNFLWFVKTIMRLVYCLNTSPEFLDSDVGFMKIKMCTMYRWKCGEMNTSDFHASHVFYTRAQELLCLARSIAFSVQHKWFWFVDTFLLDESGWLTFRVRFLPGKKQCLSQTLYFNIFTLIFWPKNYPKPLRDRSKLASPYSLISFQIFFRPTPYFSKTSTPLSPALTSDVYPCKLWHFQWISLIVKN